MPRHDPADTAGRDDGILSSYTKLLSESLLRNDGGAACNAGCGADESIRGRRIRGVEGSPRGEGGAGDRARRGAGERERVGEGGEGKNGERRSGDRNLTQVSDFPSGQNKERCGATRLLEVCKRK